MTTAEVTTTLLDTEAPEEALASLRALWDADAPWRELSGMAERALHGSRPAVRLYVAGYRELTRLMLEAARSSYPEAVTEADGELAIADSAGQPRRAAVAVLDEGAVSAPFSAWVNAYGPDDGLALHLLSRVREALPATNALVLPAGHAALAHWDVSDDAALLFITAVRRELTARRTPLDTIAEAFGLTDTELGQVFGVRRQAVAQWRTDGIPAARAEKVAAAASLADLLSRKLKAERLPGIARRAADAYGGLSMLDMIAADRHAELLSLVRGSFDPSVTA